MDQPPADDASSPKRPKLEPPDEDDEIECLFGPPSATSNSQQASTTQSGMSQMAGGAVGEEDQDSKLATFRNKVLEYEVKISQLRHEIKSEKMKSNNIKDYLEDSLKNAQTERAEASAECKHLRNELAVRDEKIDNLSRQLLKAEKDLADANKKAEDVQKAAEDARTAATEAQKKADAAQKQANNAARTASAFEQQLNEAKQKQSVAEETLQKKTAALDQELASRVDEGSRPGSSLSIASTVVDRFSSAHRANANPPMQPPDADYDEDDEDDAQDMIESLKTELAEKKKELRVQKANATKASNKNKTLEAEIQRLKRSFRETLVDIKVETGRLQQAMASLKGVDGDLIMKCDKDGIAVHNVPPRATLPSALLEMRPGYFEKFMNKTQCIASTNNEILQKILSTKVQSKTCEIWSNDSMLSMDFYGENNEDFDPTWRARANPKGVQWSPFADKVLKYACTFSLNYPQLVAAVAEFTPVVIDFDLDSKCVSITDSEERLAPGDGGNAWKSYLPGSHRSRQDHRNFSNFKLFDATASKRIFVDSKHLLPCIGPCSFAGAQAVKSVQVSLSESVLRLVFGNTQFNITYYIPTVAPDATTGQRCYSPIDWDKLGDGEIAVQSKPHTS